MPWVVAEAWAASGPSVPGGGRARDSAGARDMLLVAALDRSGNQAVFETTISRRRFRAPVLERSRAHCNNFRVPVLDETLFATSGFDVPEANQTRHLELHVAVVGSCIVAWNDQGGFEQARQAVQPIFRSIYLTPADR